MGIRTTRTTVVAAWVTGGCAIAAALVVTLFATSSNPSSSTTGSSNGNGNNSYNCSVLHNSCGNAPTGQTAPTATVDIPGTQVLGSLPAISATWQVSGSDPHDGCLNLRGSSIVVAQKPVVLAGRTVATLIVYANPGATCGLVWAELWTKGVAPDFASSGIRHFELTIAPVEPATPPSYSVTWDKDDIDVAAHQDEWTDAYQIRAATSYAASVTVVGSATGTVS